MNKVAYTPTEWKDHIVERPRTYTISPNDDGTITLHPVSGTVEQQGTPVSAKNLNHIEQGVAYTNALALLTASRQEQAHRQLILTIEPEDWKPTTNVPKAEVAAFAETETVAGYVLTMPESWAYANGCEIAFDVSEVSADPSAKTFSVVIGEQRWNFAEAPALTAGSVAVVTLSDPAEAGTEEETVPGVVAPSETVYTEKTSYTYHAPVEGLTADVLKTSIVYTVPDESAKAVNKAKAIPIKQGDGALKFRALKKPDMPMSFSILLITIWEEEEA